MKYYIVLRNNPKDGTGANKILFINTADTLIVDAVEVPTPMQNPSPVVAGISEDEMDKKINIAINKAKALWDAKQLSIDKDKEIAELKKANREAGMSPEIMALIKEFAPAVIGGIFGGKVPVAVAGFNDTNVVDEPKQQAEIMGNEQNEEPKIDMNDRLNVAIKAIHDEDPNGGLEFIEYIAKLATDHRGHYDVLKSFKGGFEGMSMAKINALKAFL